MNEKTASHAQPLGAFALERVILPIDAIEPDPHNRRVLDDDEFQGLVDSIRVLGLLQPIQVRLREDGRYQLIDGERRWRAAYQAGLTEIPCDLWPEGAKACETALAGFALNEQRKAPGCVHVARRLRDLKNELGYTHEQLAAHASLPLDRVKTYFALFGASDFLLTFFEQQDIPLKVAVEFVRFEKSTNEAHARKLVARYQEQPLTALELATLRKRLDGKRGAKSESGGKPGEAVPTKKNDDSPARTLLSRVEALFARDRDATLRELEALVARLGYRLAAAETV
jgi:ParB/RepB/Spo0J family partition protein